MDEGRWGRTSGREETNSGSGKERLPSVVVVVVATVVVLFTGNKINQFRSSACLIQLKDV